MRLTCARYNCRNSPFGASSFCLLHKAYDLPEVQRYLYTYLLQAIREASAKGLNRGHMKRKLAPYLHAGEKIRELADIYALEISAKICDLLSDSGLKVKLKEKPIESQLDDILTDLLKYKEKGDKDDKS